MLVIEMLATLIGQTGWHSQSQSWKAAVCCFSCVIPPTEGACLHNVPCMMLTTFCTNDRAYWCQHQLKHRLWLWIEACTPGGCNGLWHGRIPPMQSQENAVQLRQANVTVSVRLKIETWWQHDVIKDHIARFPNKYHVVHHGYGSQCVTTFYNIEQTNIAWCAISPCDRVSI